MGATPLRLYRGPRIFPRIKKSGLRKCASSSNFRNPILPGLYWIYYAPYARRLQEYLVMYTFDCYFGSTTRLSP